MPLPTDEADMQKIGTEAVIQALEGFEKLLVYAEVEQGMSTTGLFVKMGDGSVLSLDPGSQLDDAIYDYWLHSREATEWRALEYAIEDGKFDARLTYPEQISEEEGFIHRRPEIVTRHLGRDAVDYLGPGPGW